MTSGLQLRPFKPISQTKALNVTTSTQTENPIIYPGAITQQLTQPQIPGAVRQIQFTNQSPTTVYITFGKTGSRGGANFPTEPPTAVIPVVGTPGSMPIPPGTVLVYTIGERVDSFAFIGAAATTLFYYTIGEGT